MKKIILYLLIFTPILNISAQKKNTIYLVTNNISHPKRAIFFYILDQYGIGYERKLNKKFSASVLLSEWYSGDQHGKILDFSGTYNGAYFEPCNGTGTKSCEKKVARREKYKFIDIGVGYNIYKHKRYGSIDAQLAMGYTWGKNIIIDTVELPAIPPYDDIGITLHTESAKYFSIIPSLSYNYYFWKQRINVGIQAKGRYFFHIEEGFKQYEWGIHIGYNF